MTDGTAGQTDKKAHKHANVSLYTRRVGLRIVITVIRLCIILNVLWNITLFCLFFLSVCLSVCSLFVILVTRLHSSVQFVTLLKQNVLRGCRLA